MRKILVPTVTAFQFVAEASAQTAATPSPSGALLQMLLGLFAILALLAASLWLLKKLTMQRGAAAGLLRVIAATPVGGRERVVIVEVGSTWLVLGVAPGRVSALAEIPRQALPNNAPGKARDATTDTTTDAISSTTAGTRVAAMPAWLQRLMRKS